MDKNKQREAQIKATAFVEYLKATDEPDMVKCIEDMQKLAEVDTNAAKVIAAAFRAKQLPILARNAGLDEQQIAELLEPSNEHVENFADEKEVNDDPIAEEPVVEEPVDDIAEEADVETPAVDDLEEVNEPCEVNDGEQMAEITIQAPVEMIDKIQTMLSELTGMEVENDFEADGTSPFEAEETFEEPVEDTVEFEEDSETPEVETEEEAPSFEKEDETPEFETEETEKEETEEPEAESKEDDDKDNKQDIASRGDKVMDKETLAQRKAEREAILAKLTRTAEENTDDQNRKPKDIGLGKDTSFNGKPFQYADGAQPQNEVEYPSMTMENSEGNSLKGDPGFNKIPVPTKNPDNLQLSDAYETFNFEGNGDGSLEWSVDFDKVDMVPSAGDTATDQKFEVPTQNPQLKHKTTVARVVECQGCKNEDHKEVHTVECLDCGAKIAICEKCEDDGYCPSCAATVKTSKTEEVKSEKEEEAKVEIPSEEVEITSETDETEKKAEVFKARLKTAYAVSYQLALAGVINPEEVDDNVEMWISDGLSSKAMKVQGKLMIRSASNASQRVATAAAERFTSNREVVASVNPSFVSNTNYSDTNVDLKQALKGIFTTVEVPEE